MVRLPKLFTLGALAAAAAGGLPLRAGAVTYDLVADYSAANNPNGPWAYGLGTGGQSFSPFTTETTASLSGTMIEMWANSHQIFGFPLAFLNVGAAPVVNGTGFWPTDALLVHPDTPTDVIVQWKAPAAGVYSYSGLFEVLDHYPTGVTTEIFLNHQQIYSHDLGRTPADLQTLTPGSTDRFSGTVDVNAGDKLFFVVNSEGDRNFDSTGFAVTITGEPIGPGVPEPASWALLLVGVGVVGAALRARRAHPAGPERSGRAAAGDSDGDRRFELAARQV